MKHKREAYQLLHDGVLALARVEQQGLRIDVGYIKKQKRKITKQITELEEGFYDSDFFKEWKDSVQKKKINIYSPTQLSYFLYRVKKLESPKKTASGGDSTDEETLKRLNIPELDILLKIKKLKKIKDTYLASFEREQTDGYLHPFYNLHIARTYRSSSDRPNFQNIPIRDEEAMMYVRQAIYPRPGHQLWEIDYSQLEVRISACYNKDPQLIHDILEGDMHRDMAMEIFKLKKYDPKLHKTLRAATKNGFVFPQFYGDYYKNCAENMACTWGELPKGRWKSGQGIQVGNVCLSDHMIENDIKSYMIFEKHVQEIERMFWQERYRTYSNWKESWWKKYQRRGYVTTKTGFVFQGVMSRNDVINYPVQGAAFHCLLWSLIEIMKVQLRERWDTKIVGQIHDSIIIDMNPKEVDHVIPIIKCIMCNDVRQHWPWIIVPLEIEADVCPVDGSWAEKKPFNIN